MSRSGAPQVLLETARMLKENGYEVCIVSARQGAMTGEISDIDVFSCRFLEKTFMKLIVKADPYACIINTVIMYKWAKYLGDRNVGSVWWIHEAETYISQHYRSVPEAFSDCVKIFCVSEWSLRALNRYLPSLKAGVLYYGIDADERADAGVIPSAADGKLHYESSEIREDVSYRLFLAFLVTIVNILMILIRRKDLKDNRTELPSADQKGARIS